MASTHLLPYTESEQPGGYPDSEFVVSERYKSTYSQQLRDKIMQSKFYRHGYRTIIIILIVIGAIIGGAVGGTKAASTARRDAAALAAAAVTTMVSTVTIVTSAVTIDQVITTTVTTMTRTLPPSTTTMTATISAPSPSPSNCVWEGTPPFCDGKCNTGFTQMKEDNCGDSSACCWTGFRVYCCQE